MKFVGVALSSVLLMGVLHSFAEVAGPLSSTAFRCNYLGNKWESSTAYGGVERWLYDKNSGKNKISWISEVPYSLYPHLGSSGINYTFKTPQASVWIQALAGLESADRRGLQMWATYSDGTKSAIINGQTSGRALGLLTIIDYNFVKSTSGKLIKSITVISTNGDRSAVVHTRIGASKFATPQ